MFFIVFLFCHKTDKTFKTFPLAVAATQLRRRRKAAGWRAFPSMYIVL
jgi:hypothetical protein